MASSKQSLDGISILVVEDEYYLAADLVRYLKDSGAAILGPVGDNESALQLIDAKHPDIAIVDVNLSGKWAIPVIDALRTRSVPFIIASGYSDRILGENLGQHGSVEKPYKVQQLRSLIDSAILSFV